MLPVLLPGDITSCVVGFVNDISINIFVITYYVEARGIRNHAFLNQNCCLFYK